MTDHKTTTKEYALYRSIELLDAGTSREMIMAELRDHADDVTELFAMIDAVSASSDMVVPTRDVFDAMISDIISTEDLMESGEQAPVTGIARSRYYQREGGRPSIMSVDQHYTHSMNWKAIVPVGVIVVLAFVLLAGGDDRHVATNTQTLTQSGEEMTETLPAVDFDESNPVESIDNALALLDSIIDQQDAAANDAIASATDLGFDDLFDEAAGVTAGI